MEVVKPQSLCLHIDFLCEDIRKYYRFISQHISYGVKPFVVYDQFKMDTEDIHLPTALSKIIFHNVCHRFAYSILLDQGNPTAWHLFISQT